MFLVSIFINKKNIFETSAFIVHCDQLGSMKVIRFYSEGLFPVYVDSCLTESECSKRLTLVFIGCHYA